MLKLFGAVPSVILGILVTKVLRQTFLSFKNTLHDENFHVKVQTYVFESLNFLASYLLPFLIKALTQNTSGFFIKNGSVMPILRALFKNIRQYKIRLTLPSDTHLVYRYLQHVYSIFSAVHCLLAPQPVCLWVEFYC